MMQLDRNMQMEDGNISESMQFIEESLNRCNLKPQDKTKALLLSEECLVELIKVSDKSCSGRLSVRKFMGTTTIRMSAKGDRKIEMGGAGTRENLDMYDDFPAAEQAIRNMILRANSHILRLSYRHGVNNVNIIAGEPTQKNVINMLTSLMLAVVICLFIRIVFPAAVSDFINKYILLTVKKLFLNGINMIVAPLIFFSIASCVSSFTDLSELGKIGSKVMIFYTATTFLAAFVALFVWFVWNPGETNSLSYLASDSASGTSANTVDVLSSLINIMPSNFVRAFYNSDTLQIIVLAIVLGLATPLIGEKSAAVSEFFNAGNELFLRVAMIISKAMPFAVFSFIGSLVLTMEIDAIKSIALLVAIEFVCFATMVLIYNLIILIYAHENPINFAKKAFPAWIGAFALSSSNASITNTMNVCDKELKISPKLYSFSIPLGATINMDAGTIMNILALNYFAKAFGVTLTTPQVIVSTITIILLAMGSPGIPGASVVISATLFSQNNIPSEALGLFIGFLALTDPVVTANNVFGDVVGTYCVAKKEDLFE